MSANSRQLKLHIFALLTSFALSPITYALNLVDSIAEAEKNDPTLASAIANRDAAAENIGIARSRLLPQLNAQGSYARANQSIEQTAVTGQTSNRNVLVNSKNSQINIKQALIRPADWVGFDIGTLQAEYGYQKLLSAQSELWFRTISLWTDLLAAKENLRAQEEAVASSGHAAEQAKKRRLAGDGTRDTEAEAVAQHELAKAQKIEASETYATRQVAFRLLTRQDGNFKNIKLPHYTKLKFRLSEDVGNILEVNPELISAKLAEAISEKRFIQAKMNHYPTVDLFASRSFADSDTINTLGTKYNTSQVGVQVTIPLYSGGGLTATERQSEFTFVASKADRMAAEQKLSTQFNADWVTQKYLIERCKAAESLVRAAREQRRAAELGLKGGIRSWSDVAVADLLIARRESEYISYTANLIKTQAKILSLLPINDSQWFEWIQLTSNIAKIH